MNRKEVFLIAENISDTSSAEKLQSSIQNNTDTWLEVANLTDFMTQYGMTGSGSADIKINDLYKYLQSPDDHIKQIRNASSYLTNKHGILRDVLRTFKSLPTLRYNLIWSDYSDRKRNSELEETVDTFLEGLDITKLVRDGLHEVGELGTVVICLRSRSYAQFLELDSLKIDKQRNGRWVVEYDLKSLDSIRDIKEKEDAINSLPDEITLAKYVAYKKSNDRDSRQRYVEIDNCHVINIDARRNSPFGFPMSLGAWLPLLQKEVINRVERSVADRVIKQVLILSAGWLNKEETNPVPKEVLSAYFKQVTDLMEKRGSGSVGNAESNGLATIALPHFLELEALKVDTTLFKEELYKKIDNDIYMGLGVSPSLIMGGGGNYASANANSEKFFSFIVTVLEQFESVVNNYLEMILPKGVRCKIRFDRTTVLDKEAEVSKFKELYLQTGIAQPWIESLFGGGTFESILAQAQYEKKTLGTEDVLFPPQNAYTSSGKDKEESRQPNTENTEKTLDNDGNNTPSPS